MTYFPRFRWLIFLWLVGISAAQGEQLLRYNSNSCESLAPEYVEADFSSLGFGPDPEPREDEEDNTDNIVFESPKKSTSRNPPFELEFGANQYRRNREYNIRLVAYQYFDAFMIQIRGRRSPDGNVTYVGAFVDPQGIVRVIGCEDSRAAAVADKSRPVRLSNLTLTWKAPKEDAGPIRVVGSIAYNDAYVLIQSSPIQFNTFPVSDRGCGREFSCFRVCRSGPHCESDEAVYMLTLNPENDGEIISFKLGGYLNNVNGNQTYVAVGFGKDYSNLRNMDFVVCRKDGDSFNAPLTLEHYFLEDSSSQPQLHRSPVRLTRYDLDPETGFAWCEFTRDVRPRDIYDLDLTKKMHHFYFWGVMDDESRPSVPLKSNMYKSYYSLNASDVYSEINYNPFAKFLENGNSGQDRRTAVTWSVMPVFAIALAIPLLNF